MRGWHLEPIGPEHQDFLRDESRRMGRAETISFPVTEAEVCDALRAASARGAKVTIQGGRTGIAAGAVPEGGHILNLSRMKHIGTPHASFVSAQPGVVLSDLRAALHGGKLFFPPDPTETTATIGGMIACNASGALSLHYGPTRRHVRSLRVALADGDLLRLARGEHVASGRRFEVATEGGRRIAGALPAYTMPAVKNAAGYFAADDMDLLDLFVGSEGTLGVVTEAELALQPEPPLRWGITAFLQDEDSALRFARLARERTVARPVAIELFDRRALRLLREKRNEYGALAAIPEPPGDADAAIYCEFHGQDEDALMLAVEALVEDLARCGGGEDDTWTATDERAMQRLKDFRHAIPEAVNLTIDERRRAHPSLTKLGTDMAVPDEQLEAVMRMYHAALDPSGLEYVMFGHIGNNHVHVNIIPRDADEYERGRAVYLSWAREVIRMGGTISAEHGVGKLKVALLREMYGDEGIGQMQSLKRLFDPEGVLNRGNLFA